MRILLSSWAFSPSYGGIETVSKILAEEFVVLGHEVCLITNTPAAGAEEEYPFRVVRQPSFFQLTRLVAWSEIYFQNNFSLRYFWPQIIFRRVFVVTHQTFSYSVDRDQSSLNWLKYAIIRSFARSVAISSRISSVASLRAVLIPNPYDDLRFCLKPEITRDKELIFVGRLVSDKGVDVLLKALAQLNSGDALGLTIVGDGPERAALENLARELGVSDRVCFLGSKNPDKIATLLNQHRVLVVPSTWQEPFGVVALEGIACGCVVVGSGGGGLAEAIGPCGLVFENGAAESLAAVLRSILGNSALQGELRGAAGKHLAGYRRSYIAEQYLEYFGRIMR